MTSKINKIAVIGGGSWGTALAILFSKQGNNVYLWTKNKYIERLNINRENNKYLPGINFPKNLKIDSNFQNVCTNAKIVFIVIPSHSFRNIFNELLPFLEDNCITISAVKGIENNSLKTMTQIMNEEIRKKNYKEKRIKTGVLSGPSFAKEVAVDIPTAVTIGFNDIKTAQGIQDIINSNNFRVYASSDVIGLEISAAFKNIIAIATGVSDGIGYGLNTRAALITRGLAEITRLGIALGAKKETFSGLSGIGDLILTCTGDLSRNRSVGLKLGQGKTMEIIKKEMSMVAEGIKTTKSGYKLAKKTKIEMPILEQVYKIIYKNKNCKKAVNELLGRVAKIE